MSKIKTICLLCFSHMALFFFYIMDVFCFPSFVYCYFLLVLGCFEDRVTWLEHHLGGLLLDMDAGGSICRFHGHLFPQHTCSKPGIEI